MRRHQSIRGEQNHEPRLRRVNPSDMKASELKALVCLFLNHRPAPFITGHAFCSQGITHPSIQREDVTIHWKLIDRLADLGLAFKTPGCDISLTSAGIGIGRSLADKPINGYD